ncbi:MAG: HEAT repeat domain-containing protein [Bryobacter sp.]|nr:HEAT repeat domain-containing protein [Bryobacter sp.]
MMNCEEIRADLTLYCYGELEGEAEELLEQHLAACPACQQELLQLRQMLAGVDEAQAEPSAELLSRCRQALHEITAPSRAPVPFWQSVWERFSPPAWALRPAAALGLLAIGFAGGQVYEQRSSLSPGPEQIARVRAIQGLGDGNVRIVYDEPRVRTVSGSLQQDEIQTLLLAATREANDPGLRLESVDLLRNRCNRDDVRQVFLQTLLKDQNPAVRVRALEALRPYTQEDDVRRALSAVLLTDSSPNVRVLAIDVLVDRHAYDMVGTLQQVIRNEDNDYVRTRCLRALGAMSASPGTF